MFIVCVQLNFFKIFFLTETLKKNSVREHFKRYVSVQRIGAV